MCLLSGRPFTSSSVGEVVRDPGRITTVTRIRPVDKGRWSWFSSAAVIFLAAVFLLGGCSGGSPSAQDAVIAEIDDPDWIQVLDTPADSAFVDLAIALEGLPPEDFDGVDGHLRVWESDSSFVMIMVMHMGGPVKDGSLAILGDALPDLGLSPASTLTGIPGTIAVDMSDETGPMVGLLFFREAFLGMVVVDTDVEETLVRKIVEQQMAAIPEYDPVDGYRSWFGGAIGLALAIGLWYAIRASRAPGEQPDITELGEGT